MGSLYRNRKYWMFSYYDENGKQKTKSLGDLGTLTSKRKRELKKDLESRFEGNQLNKTKTFSLKFVINKYLDEKEKEVVRGLRSQNTLNSDKSHTKRFLDYVNDKFGRLDIEEINRELLMKYMDYRFTIDKCNSTTVGNNIRGIQGFFRYCIDEKYLEINPTSNLKIPQSISRTTDDIPNEREFKKIETFLNSYVRKYLNNKIQYDWIKLISWFQIRTGMRNGEVLSMKWRQNKKTDIGEGHSFSFVYLNMSLTKLVIHFKKKRREIPIKGDIHEVLVKMKNFENSKTYVFENNSNGRMKTGTKYDNTSFSRPFKKLLNEIGIENNYTSHTLRHGFITDLLRKDKSIVKIGTLVGHSSTRMTEIYGHLISSDLEDLLY